MHGLAALLMAGQGTADVDIQVLSDSITVDEGSQGNIQVRLTKRPPNDVIITAIETDVDISSLNPTTRRFGRTFDNTRAQWDTYQTISFQTASDSTFDDDTATITLTATYDDGTVLDTKDVNVTITDSTTPPASHQITAGTSFDWLWPTGHTVSVAVYGAHGGHGGSSGRGHERSDGEQTITYDGGNGGHGGNGTNTTITFGSTTHTARGGRGGSGGVGDDGAPNSGSSGNRGEALAVFTVSDTFDNTIAYTIGVNGSTGSRGGDASRTRDGTDASGGRVASGGYTGSTTHTGNPRIVFTYTAPA